VRSLTQAIADSGLKIGTTGASGTLRLTSGKEKASRIFDELVQTLRKELPLIVSWVEGRSHVEIDGQFLVLTFPANYSLAVESLVRPNNRALLNKILSPYELEIEFRLDDRSGSGEDSGKNF
jgi:hypothetical protein